MSGKISNLSHEIKNNFFNKDWLLVNVFNVDEIENVIKKIIKVEKPISLDTKSTEGKRSKQYMLYDHFKNNEILDKIKE